MEAHPLSDTLFVFCPADPFGDTDAEYVLLTNTDITIQVAPYAGGYYVNRWIEKGETMEHFGPFRSLVVAKSKAVEISK